MIHQRIRRISILGILTLVISACGGHDEMMSPQPVPLTPDFGLSPHLQTLGLPTDFPTPKIPPDNLPNAAKIELGRYLFYDVRLSGNQTYSCGSCHQQALGFTDGLPVAVGSTDETHRFGAMSIVNSAYAASLGWANPAVNTLEEQALIPLFGEQPIELGLSFISEEELLDRIRSDARYIRLFPLAFPMEDDGITVGNIARAIATFERTIISQDSPFDRYQAGDKTAMSESAIRGMELFFSEKVECFHCHGGFNFSDSITSPDLPFAEKPFHNNGMYNLDGRGVYPTSQGLFDITGEREHRGKFKAPTLRNIAVTAPYLHDGSASSLDEIIDLYAAGGRAITDGPYAGDGTQHPNKSPFVAGFDLTEDEKSDLIAFLNALTDQTLLQNPAYSDPFEETQ